jgi:hypothetical protein
MSVRDVVRERKLVAGRAAPSRNHLSSVEERASRHRRAILARVEITTEANPYRWLNTCFLVGEGEIDESRQNWWLDTYVCMNEQAQGAPAIGSDRPSGTVSVAPAEQP